MHRCFLIIVVATVAYAAAGAPPRDPGGTADAERGRPSLVFSGAVAWRSARTAAVGDRGGTACDRVGFRPDYVWRGPPADTLIVVVSDSAAFALMQPGASFLVRADRATGPALSDSCAGRWTAGASDLQETGAAYVAFHELGRPAWIRPGRPWFDLTATNLLTIARARDDAGAASVALAELREELDPPAYAAQLVAAWQSGSAALRGGVLAIARDAATPLDADTRHRLHAAVLDTCADPGAEQRRLAVALLGELGVHTAVTLLVLERLRDTDPDPSVRRAAAGALVRLAALDG